MIVVRKTLYALLLTMLLPGFSSAMALSATPAGEAATLEIHVPSQGEYVLRLHYRCEQSNAFTNTVSLTVDGYTLRAPLPMLWTDEAGDLHTDRYGNEIAPDQRLKSQENTVYITDYTRYTGRPEVFAFEAGTHTLTLTPENTELTFLGAQAVPVSQIPTHQEYLSACKSLSQGTDFLVLEAEEYSYKNDSYIRGTSSKNTQTVPYDPVVKRLNVIDDKSYNTVGQTLYYEFDIQTPGLYALTFKYCQPLKAGMSVFRTLFIDGEIPFTQAMDVSFPHTGLNQYQNLTLPQEIYLSSGKHTLAIQVTAGPIDSLYADIMGIISEMNAVTLKFKKLTGQNSDITSNIDVNRTWNVEEYMPTIFDDVARWQTELQRIYDSLYEISGQEPGFASDLTLAKGNLSELVKDPGKIPNKINLLSDDSSSAAQLLGTLLPKLSEQNMSLDRIYIAPIDQALPDAGESLLSSIGAGIRQFLYSFSPIMNESVSRQAWGGNLTVWVNKSAQYVEVLRELCAKTFTADTGIDVTFSIMPGEDKIILANASGTNPDVALCISYHLPFNFAVRGMAKNLLTYDGFLDFYQSQYKIGRAHV